MSTDITSEANICCLCHGKIHGSTVAPVHIDLKCPSSCGQLSHLDCPKRQVVIHPIDFCGFCLQNPFPALNMTTGESHPDKFFPDETFYNACLNGDLDQVKKSLAEGVYVNAVMKDDFTALMMASSKGYSDVAEHLINQGANVNAAQAESGATPLFFAAQNNHTDIVKLLINKGVNVDAPRTKDGSTPLSIAVQEGCTDSVKLLLNAGANPNATLSNGVTPLYIAAFRGNSESMLLLLEKGANLNTRTRLGVTPLFAANARDNFECMKILINAGAKINGLTAFDSSPLTIATRLGCTTYEEAFWASQSLAEPADE